jgi:hypothetical protein
MRPGRSVEAEPGPRPGRETARLGCLPPIKPTPSVLPKRDRLRHGLGAAHGIGHNRDRGHHADPAQRRACAAPSQAKGA